MDAYETGEGSFVEIASRFSVGPATLQRWVYRWRKQRSLDASPKGGGTPSSITVGDVEALLAKLGDPTAGELTAEFNRQRPRGQRVHVSSMKRALHRYGYVVKKSADGRWRVCGRTSRPSERRTSKP